MSLIDFTRYAKKFLIALGGALAIMVVALSDDVVTKAEWLQIVIAFGVSGGVFQANNVPKEEL